MALAGGAGKAATSGPVVAGQNAMGKFDARTKAGEWTENVALEHAVILTLLCSSRSPSRCRSAWCQS